MKYSKPFALASLLCATSASFASIPTEGWYAGLSGGLSYSRAISTRTIHPHIATTAFPVLSSLYVPPALYGTLDFGVGGDIGGQVGYRICNFRGEAELLFNFIPLDSVRFSGFTIKRHVSYTNPVKLSGQAGFGAGFINAYYDFYDEENDPTWVPYLGIGIGYGYLKTRTTFSLPYIFPAVPFVGYPTVPSFTFQRSASGAMGQAIIGISYFYNDYTSWGLDYRYLSTKTIYNLDGRLQTNTLNLNFNYYFD